MDIQAAPVKWRAIAPVLPVADVPAAAAYYRDKLGFAVRLVLPRDPDLWVIAARDGVEIHLVPKDWEAGAFVLVDSVDRMADELEARGATFESGPMDHEYAMRSFAVSDPDGFVTVFWQPLLPEGYWAKLFPHRPARIEGVPEDEQPF